MFDEIWQIKFGGENIRILCNTEYPADHLKIIQSLIYICSKISFNVKNNLEILS